MSDWYMVRQLKNFRDGIRGAHPQDFRGRQMAFMARVPKDDRALADLATYIHTLKPAESMVAANETP
jgi:cytochrome c oxidase subunit 2